VKSSIRLQAIGTTNSVSSVDVAMPPATAIPVGTRKLPPAPCPCATGNSRSC
jgi:hypothetical protein